MNLKWMPFILHGMRVKWSCITLDEYKVDAVHITWVEGKVELYYMG